MVAEITYGIAPRGVATAFEETELPPQYCLELENRFINAAGGAERRQGLRDLAADANDVAGTPKLDAVHELVLGTATSMLFVSGEGKIYRYLDTASAWATAHDGLAVSAPIRSAQMGERLIFVNGVDRNVYTEDGSEFVELKAIVDNGEMAEVTALGFTDGNIDNWVTESDVAVNDIVINLTTGGKGAVTAVVTASVAHTEISSSATGAGTGTANSAAGNRYEIIDGVELNIIPTDGDPDNIATAAAETSATGVAVSAVADWNATEIRVGDFIRNTTRTALAEVTAITTTHLRVTGITGQTAGDSLVFIKSAMPIATNIHTHYGRLFLIDARDRRKIRVSEENDPRGFTNGATLDASTFQFGNLQPTGDVALAMGSYQRFFVIAGRKNVFFYSGTDPLDTANFTPVGLFPHGVVSPWALISIGNDLVFLTDDGIQTVSLVSDSSTLGRANISEAVKTTMRDEIASAEEDDIRLIHYPRRSWFIAKIGGKMYVFNYTAFFGQDQLTTRSGGEVTTQAGSWSIFTGVLASCNAFHFRRPGVLICASDNGKVFEFDQGDFDDDGTVYNTRYLTGHLTLAEPRKSVRQKMGHYIKPIFDVDAETVYTIRAFADYDRQTVYDSVVATAASSLVSNEKLPLRWRGETVQIDIATSAATGPDVISRYTLYASLHGKR